ncbi:MAG: hypothetical protein M3256_26510, partial [Actinomycetota bacterium]|nr:hypothetical protein [Actinomycetota bacterium]
RASCSALIVLVRRLPGGAEHPEQWVILSEWTDTPHPHRTRSALTVHGGGPASSGFLQFHPMGDGVGRE